MKLPHGVCKPIHTYAYDVKVLSSKEMTNYMWPLMMVSEIMLPKPIKHLSCSAGKCLASLYHSTNMTLNVIQKKLAKWSR